MADAAAAASAETLTVRLGYFGEAQPFQVARARGWFDTEDGGDDFRSSACRSGGFAVAKLDDGDLDGAVRLDASRDRLAQRRGHADVLRGSHEGHVSRPLGGSRHHRLAPGPRREDNRTPFGSTAHYHMLYIRTLFSDVSFDLINCNADCPALYDAGTIDGAFVGRVMESMKEGALARQRRCSPPRNCSATGKRRRSTRSASVDDLCGSFPRRRSHRVVAARLDADYLNEMMGLKGDDDIIRWDPPEDCDELVRRASRPSVAAAYLEAPGDPVDASLAEREAAAEGLARFEFVDPTAMQGSDYLGGGTAAALRETADFLYDIGNIASKAPAGTADIDAFYVGTTTSAQFLEDGLASVPASVLETTGAGRRVNTRRR